MQRHHGATAQKVQTVSGVMQVAGEKMPLPSNRARPVLTLGVQAYASRSAGRAADSEVSGVLHGFYR